MSYLTFSTVVYLSKTWETAQDIKHICITTPRSRLCEFANNILSKFTIRYGQKGGALPASYNFPVLKLANTYVEMWR